jgi:hypothetical protein
MMLAQTQNANTNLAVGLAQTQTTLNQTVTQVLLFVYLVFDHLSLFVVLLDIITIS